MPANKQTNTGENVYRGTLFLFEKQNFLHFFFNFKFPDFSSAACTINRTILEKLSGEYEREA